jgi:hypothetical protein
MENNNMNVEIFDISGYETAFMQLHTSKGTLTLEQIEQINRCTEDSTDRRGGVHKWVDPTFIDYLHKIMKYGVEFGHQELLRSIIINVRVTGIHRGAQDDFDSHAKRFNSLVRKSTRIEGNNATNHVEISDWYKGKILTFEDLDNKYQFKPHIVIDDKIYTKTPWGYVLSGYENNQDVLRGLVPLSVSSDFVVSMSYQAWRYVYKMRNSTTHAAPELQDMMENFKVKLGKYNWILGDNLDRRVEID